MSDDILKAEIVLKDEKIEANIEIGTRGLSTYELAVLNGFVGTLNDWLSITESDRIQTGLDRVAVDTARVAVEALFDNFDDRFLGTKTTDPTVDNDGDPLSIGVVYYNSTEGTVRFYNGVTWDEPSISAASSADASAQSASEAAADAIQTALDRIATGEDRVATEEHRISANDSETASANSETASEAARDRAEQWAEEEEDTLVELGGYSAKHHALKAASSENNANTYRDQAREARDNSITASAELLAARDTSVAASDSSIDARDASIIARNKSEEWAENGEDTEVESGQYSSKHHAIKSAASANASLTSENNASSSETAAGDSASAAATSESNSNDSATAAATSESNASDSESDSNDSAIASANSAAVSTEQAENANTDASEATASALAAAISALEAANASSCMNEAQFFANAERNRAVYKSGFAEWGKHYVNTLTYPNVNEGLWFNASGAGVFHMGRYGSGDPTGASKTNHPVINANGILININSIGYPIEGQNNLPMAPAPTVLVSTNGTTPSTGRTYNVYKYEWVVYGNKKYICIQDNNTASLDNTIYYEERAEVANSCYWFPEVWIEQLVNFHAYGCIQSGLTEVDGVTLGSTDNSTYVLFSEDWQTAGDVTGTYGPWSEFTEAQQKTLLSNPEHNIFRGADGLLYQAKVRMRGVLGLGTEWDSIQNPKISDALRYGPTKYVKPKGKLTALSNDIADYMVSTSGYYASQLYNWGSQQGSWVGSNKTANGLDETVGYKGHCYALPGFLQRINRNAGAYHPKYNAGGTAFCSEHGNRNDACEWNDPDTDCVSTETCFSLSCLNDGQDGTIGNASARPDELAYDQVVASDIEDCRLDANKTILDEAFRDTEQKNLAGETRGLKGIWQIVDCGVLENFATVSIVTYSNLTETTYVKTATDGPITPYGSTGQIAENVRIFVKGESNRWYEGLATYGTDPQAYIALHPKHGDVTSDFTANTGKIQWMVCKRSNELKAETNLNSEVINGTLENLCAGNMIGERYFQSVVDGTPGITIRCTNSIGDDISIGTEFQDGHISAVCELDGNGEWIIHTGITYDNTGGINTDPFSRVALNPVQVIYSPTSPKYTRPAFLPLLVGEKGEDLRPTGTAIATKFPEKVSEWINRTMYQRSTDAWSMDTHSTLKQTAESSSNSTSGHSAFTTWASSDWVRIHNYLTKQSYLEPCVNQGVLNRKVGDVFAVNVDLVNFGGSFINHLLNKVLTNAAVNPKSLTGFKLEHYLIHPANHLEEYVDYTPEHNPIVLGTTDSPTGKAFGVPVNVDGILGIMWVWKEMMYDDGMDMGTEAIAWTTGDLVCNAGDVIRVARDDVGDLSRKIIVAQEPINWPVANCLASYMTIDGSVRYYNQPLVYFKLWDGNGWGDDDKFQIADNTVTMLDENGNVIKYGLKLQMTGRQV